MLLSDWLLFVDKTIIALSGGHFEYFLSFPKKITLVYGLVTPCHFEGLYSRIEDYGDESKRNARVQARYGAKRSKVACNPC